MSVQQFLKESIKNQPLIGLLETHPWVIAPSEHVEEILSNPAYFSSMLILLRTAGSNTWKKGIKVIGIKGKRLPKLDLAWLEECMNGLLYHDEHIDEKSSVLTQIHRHLTRIGAIERRKVVLRSNKQIQRTLTNSVSKLDRIEQIINFETEQLGKDLRQVILADYIYLPDLPKSPDDEKPLVRLGVIPIFETIRRKANAPIKMAVLTGSLVILPQSAWHLLDKKVRKRGISIQAKPLPHDSNYVKVKLTASIRQRMVGMVTEVFAQGEIQVLVGTTALLGEGWDAPSINSLIMASYVGTFMLSNQMRGRAIRTEKGNPDKTANIWHLVCIDPKTEDGGHDFQSLTRRFQSLMGLDTKQNKIQTGIERMHIKHPPYTLENINEQNESMFTAAAKRKELFQRWQDAVSVVEDGGRKEEMQVDKKKVPRPFIFQNTLAALLIVSLFVFYERFQEGLMHTVGKESIPRYGIAIVYGLVFASPFIYKSIKVFLRHSTLENSMAHVGTAVYHTLYHIGLMKTDLTENQIHTEKGMFVTCNLKTGTTHEQKLFLRSLQEVVDPIENPRYLLIRKSRRFFLKRHDYHAVPEAIGRRKEYAVYFLKQWNKHVDKAKLVYTRTPEGRRTLVRARIKAMSTIFQKRSERIGVWK